MSYEIVGIKFVFVCLIREKRLSFSFLGKLLSAHVAYSSNTGTLSAHIQELSQLKYWNSLSSYIRSLLAHRQRLSQLIHRNSLSSYTGTYSFQTQELSKLIYRNSLSAYTGTL